MSAPDPEHRPPGDSEPEEDLSLVMPTSEDRVRPLEEDRKQLKQRLKVQKLVYDFSSQMRSQLEIDSIIRVLVEAVSELTSFRNAFVTIFEEDGKTLRGVVGSGHKRTFEIGVRLAKFQIKRIHVDVYDIPQYVQAMETGEIYYHRTKEDIINTLYAMTGLNPAILEIIRRTTRMNLALTVPLFMYSPGPNMVPLGFIAISSIKSSVDDQDVQVLKILADQASLAIYNSMLFERIKRQVDLARASEGRFRRIMDTAHDMIISYGPDGRVIFANNAIRETNLYSVSGELIDPETIHRIHIDDQPRFLEAYLGLQENIPIRGLEYRIRTDSGEWLHHSLNTAIVPDTDGGVEEIVAFIRDVTLERHREAQIIRRNKELEVLNALITNLTSAIDREEMISRSLSIIAEFTGADIISLVSLPEDGDGPLRLEGHLWVPEEYLEFMKSVFPRRPAAGMFSGTDVQFLTDMDKVPPEFRHYTDKYSIVSVISVPVVRRGKPTGYVIAGLKEQVKLDDEDIAVLRAVGDQLGLILETAHLMKDLQE